MISREEKENAIIENIEYLYKNNFKVNFATVAKALNVSRNYLYNHKNVKNKILEIRDRGLFPLENKLDMGSGRTAESKIEVVMIQREYVRSLEDENAKLKKILASKGKASET